MFRETKMLQFLEFSSSRSDAWSLVKLYQKPMREIVSDFNHRKGHYKEEASIFKFIAVSVMKNIFLYCYIHYNLFIRYYLLLLLFIYYTLQFIKN